MSATFVGDASVPAVAEMLSWLAHEGHQIAVVSDEEIPTPFIPVILDYKIDPFVVRSEWPEGYPRPAWCADSTKVLLFKARAIHCCKSQITQVIASFEAKLASNKK